MKEIPQARCTLAEVSSPGSEVSKFYYPHMRKFFTVTVCLLLARVGPSYYPLYYRILHV